MKHDIFHLLHKAYIANSTCKQAYNLKTAIQLNSQ